MRKILLGFLTLIMITPSLACVAASCPVQGASAAKAKPCHQENEKTADVPMIALDCMGVDLFQQNTNHDIQPDGSVSGIDYVWADLVDNYSFLPGNINNIRGPPDSAKQSHAESSIILTTQRFRI